MSCSSVDLVGTTQSSVQISVLQPPLWSPTPLSRERPITHTSARTTARDFDSLNTMCGSEVLNVYGTRTPSVIPLEALLTYCAEPW